MILRFPYGKSDLLLDVLEDRMLSVLEPKGVLPASDGAEAVTKALSRPICSESLTNIASKRRRICVLVSDYTRATPNRVLIPPVLEQLQGVDRGLDGVRVLVANGLHKPATKPELEEFLGEDVMEQCEVLNHDAEDETQIKHVGRTSFGTEVSVNKVVAESDLTIMTGLIEPHFFAGYSGGRKSILPGVAGKQSIYQNHSYKMIGHHLSRCGVLDGNPVHEDMLEAAEIAVKGRSYLVNVMIDKAGRLVKTFAGDMVEAHRLGVEFLNQFVKVEAPRRTGIVLTSNGGFPLDRDLYQAVKGMATGRDLVKKDGAIVVFSECLDGVGRGHEFFQRLLAEARSPEEALDKIRREEPIKDQWEAQIMAQILVWARVILVSKHKGFHS